MTREEPQDDDNGNGDPNQPKQQGAHDVALRCVEGKCVVGPLVPRLSAASV